MGQLVQNLPIVNGNGAMWKQRADRAEADRHTFYKFIDAIYCLISHICSNMQGNEGQSSIEQ
jgi:hypothetical protein